MVESDHKGGIPPGGVRAEEEEGPTMHSWLWGLRFGAVMTLLLLAYRIGTPDGARGFG